MDESAKPKTNECVCCEETFKPEEKKLMTINCLHTYCLQCLDDVKAANSSDLNAERQRCHECNEIIDVWAIAEPTTAVEEIDDLEMEKLLEKKKFFDDALETLLNDRTDTVKQHNDDAVRLLSEMRENVESIKMVQIPEKIKMKMSDFYDNTKANFLKNNEPLAEPLNKFFEDVEKECGYSDQDNKKAIAYFKTQQEKKLGDNEQVNTILHNFIAEYLKKQEEFDKREPELHAKADEMTKEDTKKVNTHLDEVDSYAKRLNRAIENCKIYSALLGARIEHLNTNNPAKRTKAE